MEAFVSESQEPNKEKGLISVQKDQVIDEEIAGMFLINKKKNQIVVDNKSYSQLEKEMLSLTDKYGSNDEEHKILYFDETHIFTYTDPKTSIQTDYDILGIWWDIDNDYIVFYGLTGNEESAFFTLYDFTDEFVEEIYTREIKNFEKDIIK